MQRIGIGIVLTCILLSVVVWAQSSTNYKLLGSNLNSGGSVSMASTSYKANITLGQSSPIGVSSSTSYQAQIGVQYIYHAQAIPNSYLLWTK
ncbi:hypothetical protein U27_04719 [Candidatus Vecturithrix granuli]|uniref:Uncharacterized protein n=1 Tax=Vecturithrix granuli TaxID=1499967 RepID=A0A081BZJ7_VECG1|nr:hypothetical protein U27_04719 [Candidatus Vecturithrix granuli]